LRDDPHTGSYLGLANVGPVNNLSAERANDVAVAFIQKQALLATETVFHADDALRGVIGVINVPIDAVRGTLVESLVVQKPRVANITLVLVWSKAGEAIWVARNAVKGRINIGLLDFGVLEDKGRGRTNRGAFIGFRDQKIVWIADETVALETISTPGVTGRASPRNIPLIRRTVGLAIRIIEDVRRNTALALRSERTIALLALRRTSLAVNY
jgi:hypothetical protein